MLEWVTLILGRIASLMHSYGLFTKHVSGCISLEHSIHTGGGGCTSSANKLGCTDVPRLSVPSCLHSLKQTHRQSYDLCGKGNRIEVVLGL